MLPTYWKIMFVQCYNVAYLCVPTIAISNSSNDLRTFSSPSAIWSRHSLANSIYWIDKECFFQNDTKIIENWNATECDMMMCCVGCSYSKSAHPRVCSLSYGIAVSDDDGGGGNNIALHSMLPQTTPKFFNRFKFSPRSLHLCECVSLCVCRASYW